MSNYERILKQTAEVWCPDYPRRVAGLMGADWGQLDSHQPEELVHHLLEVRGSYPGYVSTYSFPEGHPTDDSSNIPRINTLMIDFDIDKSKFINDGKLVRHKWAFHIKKLLDKLNAVAESLIEADKGQHFRWSLSGYKGAHIYLDFPELERNIGTSEQFENGMATFTDLVVKKLQETTGAEDLHRFIDVSSGWDLSRLTRLPNTVHEKGTEKFGETKYCVPVTTEEMAELDPSDYVKLTREPRLPDSVQRNPREKSAEVSGRHIKISQISQGSGSSSGTPSVADSQRLEDYRDEIVNEEVNLKDVAFLLKRKPCIWDFRSNEQMFSQGNASHVMENQCIIAMASIGTPIRVMNDFFKASDRYDEQDTQDQIEAILSRNYSEFNCSKILDQAPQFCRKEDGGPNGNGCKIYKGDMDLQQSH